MSDIAAIITADTSDFSEPILQAHEDAESFFTYIVEGGKNALTSMGSMLAQLATDIASETKAVLLEVGHELGAIALKTALAGSAATATSSYFVGFWNTMRLGLTIGSWFVPWLKAISIGLTAATLATYAYQKADEYLNGELTKSLLGTVNVTKSIDTFKDSLADVRDALFVTADGLGSIGAQLTKIAVDWSGASTAISAFDAVATFHINAVSDVVKLHVIGLNAWSDTLADTTAAGGASAAQLRNMAKATEELITKQQQQAELFGTLRAMQEGAAVQAEHTAEIQRIGSLTTVDAVNAEVTALQQRAAAAIQSGEVTEEAMKRTGALFLALENQKNNIASGKMDKKPEAEKKTAAQSAIESAEQALAQLTLGRDDATIAAIQAAGATDEEMMSLRDLQVDIAAVTAAEEARREAEKQSQAIIENQKRMQEQGTERIARMVDEIDLLSGAATTAEIAMRQMAREGFSQEQIDEVGRLQEKLDELKEKPNKVKADQSRTLTASFAGSQEAASILLRGVGGGKGIEAIANKQLNVQQQTLLAIKANKPPALTPVTLGT